MKKESNRSKTSDEASERLDKLRRMLAVSTDASGAPVQAGFAQRVAAIKEQIARLESVQNG